MVTFSGWSGGGYMTQLMHMVYSDTIKGVAIHEGGTYAGKVVRMMETKDDWKEYVKKAEAEKSVELPLEKNLKDAPVMITSGKNDAAVPPPI